MAKDPAFLFYSSDFLTGVSDLTFEERGQYITLLCLQHQKGHLSPKSIQVAVPGVSSDVLSKFNTDADGNLFNERLEIEREKRSASSDKQRQRALDGWEKRKSEQPNGNPIGKATADATALPLENEVVNENRIATDIKTVRYFASEELDEVFQKWLYACAHEVKPLLRKVHGQSSIEALAMKLNVQPVDYSIKQVKQSLENGWVTLRAVEDTAPSGQPPRKRQWE